jgi:cell division septation protein DedD
MAYLFDTEEEQETRKGRRGAALGRAVGTDAEITLGTRSLLGIFFGLVLVCSVFFGLGYSVGRGSGSRAAAQAATDASTPPDSHLSKPSPQQSLTPVETPPADAGQAGAAPGTPESTPALQPASAPAPPASSPALSPASARIPAVAVAPKPAAAMVPAAGAQSFMVQVAAVRVPQDADILVDALKKHGYTAVVRNEPQDQLLHVQLGPFTSRGDANAMRSKLLADGYNAVVK